MNIQEDYRKTFTLKSKELGGQAVRKQLQCDGDNISPQLYWENPPEGTQSYAVTMYDKDAPTGSGWWHWIIFDIPASENELVSDAGNVAKNVVPFEAIQIRNSSGAFGYAGPCPPKGDRPHEYKFTVYALKVKTICLREDATPEQVGFTLQAQAIQKASLIIYHQR